MPDWSDNTLAVTGRYKSGLPQKAECFVTGNEKETEIPEPVATSMKSTGGGRGSMLQLLLL